MGAGADGARVTSEIKTSGGVILPRRSLLLSALLAGWVWSDEATATSISYMVFFASGQAVINSWGERTLQEVAKTVAKLGPKVIVVSSHTDTAEASDALSIARGMAVRDRLIELGMPADRIRVKSNADRQLLAITGPNTPEPQNRRVEIVFY